MALMPIGDPYVSDPQLAFISEGDMTNEQRASLNNAAPKSGSKYVFLLALANVGYVMALSACDGVLVELSQREPESIRGTAQTVVCIAQELFQCLAQALVGFGLNSWEYGGTWTEGLGMNGIMLICSISAFLVIPISWLCIAEERSTMRSIREICGITYELIQVGVVQRIIAFRFFWSLFSGVSVTAALLIQQIWAHVTPMENSAATVIGSIMSFLTWSVIKQQGLEWNWRTMVITSQVAVVFFDIIPAMCTIWNVYRAPWLWLASPVLTSLPDSINYLVGMLCVMEIVGIGNEGTMYGLISSVSTLASPFSTILTKYIDASLKIDAESLQVDDESVRQHVTSAYGIAYGFKLLSLIFVMWLPHQKAETQELMKVGTRSKLFANLAILYLTFALFWSLIANILAFSSVACSRAVGGDGC